MFNELTPAQCAAVLSCLVFDEKSNNKDANKAVLKEHLAKPYRALIEQAQIIVKIAIESKLKINEEEYIKGITSDLMEVVYSWTQGASFATICKMTEVYEGSLIRMFRRLEELLMQMMAASKVMGSEELEKKFEAALALIKRGLFSISPTTETVVTVILQRLTCLASIPFNRHRGCSIALLVRRYKIEGYTCSACYSLWLDR
ncbi:hypothetical protein ABW21_db0206991 [Orbilia brochopaga]|nr:hypothetical protein ABW21_db0206991 [Drechslerella brochopaga]